MPKKKLKKEEKKKNIIRKKMNHQILISKIKKLKIKIIKEK